MGKYSSVTYTYNIKHVLFVYLFNTLLCYRRESSWSLFSSYSCWQQLVSQTKTLSKDHAALSEVYSTHLVSRLQQVAEDVQRIYKRVSVPIGLSCVPFTAYNVT